MKKYIFLSMIVGIAFFMNAYADQLSDRIKAACLGNGYPLDQIIKTEENIQEALKTNNLSLFAEQFSYPFAVNLKNRTTRTIATKQELIENFSHIFTQEDIKQILAEKDLNYPFCKSEGAAIFSGMWLSKDKNEKLKVFAINASKDATLTADIPYGNPIAPVADMQVLEKFADTYNHSDDSIKIEDAKLLKAQPKWNSTYKPNLTSDEPYPRGFLLYHVDINNDGEAKWVLVYPSEGSMGTSGIAHIYRDAGAKLQMVDFDEAILANFQLVDMSRWYLFVAEPFITLHQGKIILNFNKGTPPQVCSYLWQNAKIILVKGNPDYCIHSKF